MNKMIRRCENEHFYNPSVSKECPFCKKYSKEISEKYSNIIVFEAPGKTKGKHEGAETYMNSIGTDTPHNAPENAFETTVILSEEEK